MSDANGPDAFRRYEQFGAYHHEMMERDELYIAKVRKALSLVRPGAVVLDVGCGDGVFVKHARGMGARIIGIDPAAAGIALARKTAGCSMLCVGSADSLPFRTGSIDLIVMIDVVNYLPRCKEAIEDATRALKRGGVLVIMSPCEPGLEDERAAFPDSWQAIGWELAELEQFVARQLRISEVAFIEKVVPSPVLAAVLRWIRRTPLEGFVRQLMRALTRPADIAPPTAAAPTRQRGGNIVLNTFPWPARRYEQIEFIIVAVREDAAV
jgi:ubiquinone/menaquinone biosynthesis C-methylase UbiE